MQAADAFAFETNQLTGLDGFGNIQFDRTVQGFYFHDRAQRRLAETDVLFGVDVKILASESRVGPDMDADIQVAGLAAAAGRLTITGQTNGFSAFDFNLFVFFQRPAAAAMLADFFRFLALAMTGRTNRRGLESAENRALDRANLALASALATGGHLAPGFHARAGTNIANRIFVKPDGLFGAKNRFFEINFHIYLNVLAFARPTTATPPTGGSTENIAEAAEDVAQIAKVKSLRRAGKIAKAVKTGKSALGLGLLKSGAELVVLLALLRVRQNLKGLIGFFEFLRVAAFLVRMILMGQTAKSRLDVVHRGGFIYAENFVVVFGHTFCHSERKAAIVILDPLIQQNTKGILRPSASE